MKNTILIISVLFISGIVKSQNFKDLRKQDKILGFVIKSSFEELDTLKIKLRKTQSIKNNSGYSFYKAINMDSFVIPSTENQTLVLSYFHDQLFSVSIFFEADKQTEESVYQIVLTHLENLYGKNWKKGTKTHKNIRNFIYWKNSNIELQLKEVDIVNNNTWKVHIHLVEKKIMRKFVPSPSFEDELIIL